MSEAARELDIDAIRKRADDLIHAPYCVPPFSEVARLVPKVCDEVERLRAELARETAVADVGRKMVSVMCAPAGDEWMIRVPGNDGHWAQGQDGRASVFATTYRLPESSVRLAMGIAPVEAEARP